MPAAKTNAVRLLERLAVPFELRSYEVDPDDLSAETVARKIGLPPGQTFKTLVTRGHPSGICLAVVPGDAQLDPKALARATGDKKVETVPLKDVEPLTGYVRGGVTALACKKDYPVYLDEIALLHDLISVSAGVRGLRDPPDSWRLCSRHSGHRRPPFPTEVIGRIGQGGVTCSLRRFGEVRVEDADLGERVAVLLDELQVLWIGQIRIAWQPCP